MPRKKIVRHYTRTEYEYEAYKWCINNGIYISPFALNDVAWYIDIVNKEKQNRSPQTYDEKELWPEIYKFYVYYYERFNKDKQSVRDAIQRRAEDDLRAVRSGKKR